jgi:hypothetical protein
MASPNTSNSLTRPAPTDLSDSIDLRLIAAGRITPTAIPIRRDRAELAAVLGHSLHLRSDRDGDSPPVPSLASVA